MKKEDLQDAIGQVSDEYIESAEKLRKNPNKKSVKIAYKRVIAAAAGLAVIMTGIFAGIKYLPASSGEIAVAKYEKKAAYPTDCLNYDGAYEKWTEERSERIDAGKAVGDDLQPFCSRLMSEMLSDENAEESNVVYSPLNIYMSLALLAESAGGESRQQILDLLSLDGIEQLREQAGNVWNSSYQDDGAVTSILANSLWLDEDISYNRNALKNIAENYYASSYSGKMGSDEFNSLLQDWLNEQTGGLLEEQASEIELSPQTVLSLASTVYFKAKWATEFSEDNTLQGTFHSRSGDVECDFMNQYGDMMYFTGDNYSAAALPFEDGGYMWLILPDEGTDISALAENSQISEMISEPYEWGNSSLVKVNLSLPKFDVCYDTDLIPQLEQLGVTDVFDSSKADFSGIVDDFAYLSEVKHAARVKIDEKGCEAAAFTVMTLYGAALVEDEVDFVLDRPFLFIITSDSDMPLFTGVVNQPLQ